MPSPLTRLGGPERPKREYALSPDAIGWTLGWNPQLPPVLKESHKKFARSIANRLLVLERCTQEKVDVAENQFHSLIRELYMSATKK
eukprot:9146612-Pyramimonas_sp.AAC.1